MNAEELIHLISNQALNENMKEQHKLVIQDCCKELFKKKCDKPYKIVEYEVILKPYCKTPSCKYCGDVLLDCFHDMYSNNDCEHFNPFNCDCEENPINYKRRRVIRTDREAGTRENPSQDFPHMICERDIEKFNSDGYVFRHNGDKSYMISSIKDI